jgi:hypothetical protein
VKRQASFAAVLAAVMIVLTGCETVRGIFPAQPQTPQEKIMYVATINTGLAEATSAGLDADTISADDGADRVRFLLKVEEATQIAAAALARGSADAGAYLDGLEVLLESLQKRFVKRE